MEMSNLNWMLNDDHADLVSDFDPLSRSQRFGGRSDITIHFLASFFLSIKNKIMKHFFGKTVGAQLSSKYFPLSQ